MSQLLLIDGSSVLVRAYFATAFSGRILKSSQGVYTNAVLGFLNMLIGAIEIYQPSHIFVAWDVSRNTFRKSLYPAYKGTRAELPNEMLAQFDTMQDVLRSLGIAQDWHADYEADDLLGTLASRGAAANYAVTVLTGDRDALQLVNSQVTVAVMKKGVKEVAHYTPEVLFKEYGLSPDQMIDLKALMGDTSDNIPGVPGIGEKTAKSLLQLHGTLEQLLENMHLLKPTVREKLTTHRDLAILSKQLATIEKNAPITRTPDSCVLTWQMESAARKLSELDLHRIVQRLKNLSAS